MRRPPRWPSGPSRPGAPVRRLILEEGLLDEAALDKILDPYSMTEPGISGKELLEG